MKKIKFIALAFLALTLGSCMGDSYADPDLTDKVPAAPYGNNSLREKNVISIADLKTQFATVIANSSYKLIEKDMMIKAVVTGNDVSGNIYNQVSVQDASGAIIIAINGSGLSGYLPVGQEILINLKGLYIGSYKKLPQIGEETYMLDNSSILPVSALESLPPHQAHPWQFLEQILEKQKKKILVLDDDPTGIQTVHDLYVYTSYDSTVFKEVLCSDQKMSFFLTNSRALTQEESHRLHSSIAADLAEVSRATGQDLLLLSRGDSTLRGHWPMETEVLRQGLEAQGLGPFDGEIIVPFFPEGGRYTIGGIHYVRQGDSLIPAGETEFAKDKSFGYTSSSLADWCQERSAGRWMAKDITHISLGLLRSGDIQAVCRLLEQVKGFGKVCVDAADYEDLAVFVSALGLAMEHGKQFLFRCAAAFPKVLAGVKDRPLLERDELLDSSNCHGGIILVGSHVAKTGRQLACLQSSDLPIDFIEFDQHQVLVEGGLEKQVEQALAQAQEAIAKGRSAAVYTRRERLDLPGDDPDEQLRISAQISAALVSVISKLELRPSFIIAKGGITSSDVGTKALRVRKALVKGQILPGIPVWQTGRESKFPGLPYVIFPGNVGGDEDLLYCASLLCSRK